MKTTVKNKRKTLLSCMEDIIAKVKDFSLTPEFYEAADDSLKYLSNVLQLTKDEAMLLSFFLEMQDEQLIYYHQAIATFLKILEHIHNHQVCYIFASLFHHTKNVL